MPSTIIIPLAKIRRMEPCLQQFKQLKELYPDGVPLTLGAVKRIKAAELDARWGLLGLMDDAEAVDFLLFTLRQRQPHLVKLLRRVKLNNHAKAVKAVRFNTPEDAEAGREVLTAAWDAAGNAAWDAAGTAAWDAAGTAAWDAARAAAWDAAGNAAWDAARAAAWDAARAAAEEEQIKWIVTRLRRRLRDA